MWLCTPNFNAQGVSCDEYSRIPSETTTQGIWLPRIQRRTRDASIRRQSSRRRIGRPTVGRESANSRRRPRSRDRSKKRQPQANRAAYGLTKSRWTKPATEATEEMLGRTLVTHQTGPAGQASEPHLHRRRLRHRDRALPRSFLSTAQTQLAFQLRLPRPRAAWTSKHVAEDTPRENPDSHSRPRQRLSHQPMAQKALTHCIPRWSW